MAQEKNPSPPSKTSAIPSREQPISLNALDHDGRIDYFHRRYRENSSKLRTSTSEEVAKILAVVAATIGCEIPPVAVLAKYIDLLGHYAPELLQYAGDQILKTHKWNNFPKVAEFIDHIKDEHHDLWMDHYGLVKEMKVWGIKPPVSETIQLTESRSGMKQLGAILPQIKRGDNG